jgi:hypothetical protein
MGQVIAWIEVSFWMDAAFLEEDSFGERGSCGMLVRRSVGRSDLS